MTPTVRPVRPGDRAWAEALLAEHMGSTRVVRLGELLDPLELPGLVSEGRDGRLGLLTYIVDGDQLEVLTLHSRVEGAGAVDRDRALKPELPEVNPDTRIPLRDLLELELPLG